jgi:site-specific recombinase XerD
MRRISKAAIALLAATRKLTYFQPYTLRHTALTKLARAGCDAFTLARIAGRSSITITQRYVHPQADAIERAFAPFVGAQQKQLLEEPTDEQVGTKLGTRETRQLSESA